MGPKRKRESDEVQQSLLGFFYVQVVVHHLPLVRKIQNLVLARLQRLVRKIIQNQAVLKLVLKKLATKIGKNCSGG